MPDKIEVLESKIIECIRAYEILLENTADSITYAHYLEGKYAYENVLKIIGEL